MKKIDFDKSFITGVLKDLKYMGKLVQNERIDVDMITQDYNIATDTLHKDGEITDKQVSDWCIPESFTKRSYVVKRFNKLHELS